MADSIGFNMLIDPLVAAITSRQVRMPRAAMWSVREAGRVAKKAAQQKAPVLAGGYVSHKTLQRQRRSGYNVSASYQGNRPIPGLLKASITPSKNVKQVGVAVTLKVGPRGQRVHLYAGKIEQRVPYMEAGYQAAQAALPALSAQAFNRVWKE